MHIICVILVTSSIPLKTIFVNSVGFHGIFSLQIEGKKMLSFSDGILFKNILIILAKKPPSAAFPRSCLIRLIRTSLHILTCLTKILDIYPQVTLKSSSSHPQVTLKSPSTHPQVTLKSPSRHPQVTLKSPF
jgi:hypothetical protein